MSRCQLLTVLLVLPAGAGSLPAGGQQPAAGAGKVVRTDLYGDPLPEGALARLGTVRLRHPGRVFALAFSPDGKALAVFNGEHSGYRGLGWGREGKDAVHLWDTATGKLLRQMESDLRGEPFLALSGNDDLLIVIGRQHSTFWNAATGNAVAVPRGIGPALNAALAPDGKTVAVSSPTALRLLNVSDGKEVRPLESSQGAFSPVTFSADGKTLAAGFGYQGVSLWDVGTGRQIRKLFPAPVGQCLAFAPSGKILATSPINGPVQLWDIGTGKKLRALGDRDVYWFVAFTRDGKGILTVRDDGVTLWDAETGNKVRRFGGERDLVYYRAVLAPDGKTLAVSAGHGVRLFDIETGKERLAFAAPAAAVETAGFSPDGKTAFTGADGLSVWDVVTGKRLAAPGPRSQVGGAAFTPDGKAILAGYSKKQELRLWETTTGKALRRFEGKPGMVEFVGFLADGKSAVSMSRFHSPKNGTLVGEMSLHFWDLATGKEERRHGNGMMECAAASADGRRLAAGMNEIFVWDAASGRELAKLSKAPNSPRALALTPDGRRLAMASSVGKQPVRLWEILTGREMESIPSYDAATLALAVSPDGRVLATGGSEGTVGLWDLATGKELRKLKGHDGPVLAVAFSADGRRLLSGGRDTTALVWDVAAALPEEPAARLDAAEVKQLWVALAGPDGREALRAVRRLAGSPKQSLPFIREHLGKLPAADRDQLARLLADLDADSFAKREAATAELALLGKLAEADLKRLLEKNPSAEVRKRAEALLRKLDDGQVSPATLQAVRALEVLELIATPDARKVIAALAEGSAEARVNEEARATLARLARR